MSRTDTWMPLYIADYLADTMRLSTVQHGAYLLLLMEYWRQGPLPNDQDGLAAIVRQNRKAWDRDIWPGIKRFFELQDDGLLHQKRIDAERTKAMEISNKRRAAVLQRKDRSGSSEPTNGDQEPNNEPTNVGSNEHTRTRDARDATQSQSQSQLPEGRELPAVVPREAPPVIPIWMPADAWNGYLEMRRKAKKPPTNRAISILIGKLDEWHNRGIDVAAILDQSTVSGWTNLFEPKTSTGRSRKPDASLSSDWDLIDQRLGIQPVGRA